jgi:hypothetical protein
MNHKVILNNSNKIRLSTAQTTRVVRHAQPVYTALHRAASPYSMSWVLTAGCTLSKQILKEIDVHQV